MSSIYITDLEKSKHWFTIADNPRIIVDMTEAGYVPAKGSKWIGSGFDRASGHPPIPDYRYYAFVVNDECVHIQMLSLTEPEDIALMAAYQSEPTFEVHRV